MAFLHGIPTTLPAFARSIGVAWLDGTPAACAHALPSHSLRASLCCCAPRQQQTARHAHWHLPCLAACVCLCLVPAMPVHTMTMAAWRVRWRCALAGVDVSLVYLHSGICTGLRSRPFCCFDEHRGTADRMDRSGVFACLLGLGQAAAWRARWRWHFAGMRPACLPAAGVPSPAVPLTISADGETGTGRTLFSAWLAFQQRGFSLSPTCFFCTCLLPYHLLPFRHFSFLLLLYMPSLLLPALACHEEGQDVAGGMAAGRGRGLLLLL